MKRPQHRDSSPTIRQRDQTSFTFEQRDWIVERIAGLLGELQIANGDSAAMGERQRQRLMEELRRLGVFLWQDGAPDE